MILAADAGFHPVAADDPEWAEILSLGFAIPAEAINVRTYTLFRRQFGVAQTSVTIVSRDALVPWHADYADFRAHVPAPASLTDFAMAHGLTLETEEPHRRWRLRFADADAEDGGVAFDVTYTAIAPPYSPFDPAQNPLAPPRPEGVGHYEQSVRVVGTLRLNGRDHAIDSWTMMNHGWGPRRDRKITILADRVGIAWLHAHFADGSALYGNWTFALDRPETLTLMYGYAVRGGAVTGLASGTAAVTHDDDGYPIAIAVAALDRNGETHRLTSRSLHRSFWTAWPNIMTRCVFAEWTAADGRIGHGDILQFTDVASLIAVERRTRSR